MGMLLFDWTMLQLQIRFVPAWPLTAISRRLHAALLVFSGDLPWLVFLRLPTCGDGDLGFSPSFAGVVIDGDLLLAL